MKEENKELHNLFLGVVFGLIVRLVQMAAGCGKVARVVVAVVVAAAVVVVVVCVVDPGRRGDEGRLVVVVGSALWRGSVVGTVAVAVVVVVVVVAVVDVEVVAGFVVVVGEVGFGMGKGQLAGGGDELVNLHLAVAVRQVIH